MTRGDRAEERVAGRVAARVVERLEPVEIEHQDRERRGLRRRSRPPRRARAGRSRGCAGPVSASRSARTRTAPCVSAFWRAIDACAANSWVSSNSFALNARLVVAHPADVERADRLAVDEQRDDDHRLGLERGAGDLDRAWIEVGAVGQDGLAVVDDPAGQPGPERDLVGEDQLGEAVAGDDRAADWPPPDRPGRSSASRTARSPSANRRSGRGRRPARASTAVAR